MVDAEQLGRAVIKQALSDAGLLMERGQRVGVSGPDRDAARNFLTAASGTWKEAREFWAALADLDPDKLRTGTMKLLGIEAPPPSQPVSDQPLRLFYPVPKPTKPPRVRRLPNALAPKGMSKKRQIVEWLKRPEGVSLEEIVESFGWKRSTAQTAVNYDIQTYGVRGKLCHDGRYRLVHLQ